MADYRVPVLEQFNWQPSVKDRLADPPVSPVKGDRYIIIATASGAWIGRENDIAYCSNAVGPVWSYDTPVEGHTCWVDDENEFYTYDGTSWTITGLSGYSGYSGYSGISGYSGYSGISGYSGYSGISGYSGYSGISGYSGYSGPGATYDSDYKCLIITT